MKLELSRDEAAATAVALVMLVHSKDTFDDRWRGDASAVADRLWDLRKQTYGRVRTPARAARRHREQERKR